MYEWICLRAYECIYACMYVCMYTRMNYIKRIPTLQGSDLCVPLCMCFCGCTVKVSISRDKCKYCFYLFLKKLLHLTWKDRESHRSRSYTHTMVIEHIC